MLRNIYNKIPRFLLNKYLITGVAFIVWLFFFDENNLISLRKLKSDLNNVKKEHQFYLDEISRDSTSLRKLATDSSESERIGRERYNMKRDSEDVFIIVHQKKDNK